MDGMKKLLLLVALIACVACPDPLPEPVDPDRSLGWEELELLAHHALLSRNRKGEHQGRHELTQASPAARPAHAERPEWHEYRG